MDDRDKLFRDGLKLLRTTKKLSQDKLADISSVQRVSISQIETGARPASASTQWALANALGTTPEQLMSIGAGKNDGQAFMEPNKRSYPPRLEELITKLEKLDDRALKTIADLVDQLSR